MDLSIVQGPLAGGGGGILMVTAGVKNYGTIRVYMSMVRRENPSNCGGPNTSASPGSCWPNFGDRGCKPEGAQTTTHFVVWKLILYHLRCFESIGPLLSEILAITRQTGS
jgi:hypothetical protein